MPDIDNFTFFRIVDKQIREAMQQVETELLPVAEQALEESGLQLQQYPVEGYYGKTSELTQFFNHIRTLQSHSSNNVGDAIRKLHDFYTDEVFGLGQAVKTAINSEGVWYPNEDSVVISPMVDPLTVALIKVAGDNPKQNLTIENITEKLEEIDLGKGLVGFASLVDKIKRKETGEYNPIATTLARETTVLSAYVPTFRCIPEYNVSPEVERQGNMVIDAYNAIFERAGLNIQIQNVTRKNAFGLNHDLPELDRCVRIFNVDIPGQPKEFYHWAVVRDGYKPKVADFWREEVVTTDMFKEQADSILQTSK